LSARASLVGGEDSPAIPSIRPLRHRPDRETPAKPAPHQYLLALAAPPGLDRNPAAVLLTGFPLPPTDCLCLPRFSSVPRRQFLHIPPPQHTERSRSPEAVHSSLRRLVGESASGICRFLAEKSWFDFSRTISDMGSPTRSRRPYKSAPLTSPAPVHAKRSCRLRKLSLSLAPVQLQEIHPHLRTQIQSAASRDLSAPQSSSQTLPNSSLFRRHPATPPRPPYPHPGCLPPPGHRALPSLQWGLLSQSALNNLRAPGTSLAAVFFRASITEFSSEEFTPPNLSSAFRRQRYFF